MPPDGAIAAVSGGGEGQEGRGRGKTVWGKSHMPIDSQSTPTYRWQRRGHRASIRIACCFLQVTRQREEKKLVEGERQGAVGETNAAKKAG